MEIIVEPKSELDLPYIVSGDNLYLVGTNRQLKYAWIWFLLVPLIPILSKFDLDLQGATLEGIIKPLGIALAFFFFTYSGLRKDLDPAKSSALVLNRKKGELLIGNYEDKSEMVYKVIPFSDVKLCCDKAFSITYILRIAVEGEYSEWSREKFSRFSDDIAAENTVRLIEEFMRGEDSIVESQPKAEEFLKEMKKHPALPGNIVPGKNIAASVIN